MILIFCLGELPCVAFPDVSLVSLDFCAWLGSPGFDAQESSVSWLGFFRTCNMTLKKWFGDFYSPKRWLLQKKIPNEHETKEKNPVLTAGNNKIPVGFLLGAHSLD